MFRKFLVFLAFFAFGFLPGRPADAQILSSFFGRPKATEQAAPQAVPALVPSESDLAAAVAARKELLKAQPANNPIAQVAYHAPKADFAPIDERQITIECRLMTVPAEKIAPTGFTFENGWLFVPKQKNSEHRYNQRLEKGDGAVGAVQILETYSPTLFRFIDEKNTEEFFHHALDSQGYILMAPKMTLFNGEFGVISDMCETPFVTGVTEIIADDSTDYLPDIEILKEGIHLEFGAEIQEDGSVLLKRSHFLFQRIEKKSSTVAIEEGKVTVQNPQIGADCVKMPVTIPQGKSLLVALPGWIAEVEKTESRFFGLRKTSTREKLMHCLMITPKVIDPDEVRFEETNRALDVAIDGEGFFRVVDPYSGEILYTRTGHFTIDPKGNIILGSGHTGYLVSPQMTIPKDATHIQINEDGTVWVAQGDRPQLQQVGQFQLSTFGNPDALISAGRNVLQRTNPSGPPIDGVPGKDGMGTLKQSMLEIPKEPVAKKNPHQDFQYTSENLRQIEDEWEKIWLTDQPNEMSPARRAGGIL